MIVVIGNYLHTISASLLCQMPSPPLTLFQLIHNCLQYLLHIYSQLSLHYVCTSASILSTAISIASAHLGTHPRMTLLRPSARQIGSPFASSPNLRLCLTFCGEQEGHQHHCIVHLLCMYPDRRCTIQEAQFCALPDVSAHKESNQWPFNVSIICVDWMT